MEIKMVELIISGGQTGADLAGLYAANLLGIKTGGMAPKGFKTETGPNNSLRDRFNLIEDTSTNYQNRTYKNVYNSDGTALFGNSESPGSLCAINAIKKYNKHLIINPTARQFIDWIVKNDIKILNIAGNRESKRPGIFDKVYNFLIYCFTNFELIKDNKI
jgi:hypothetical protein